jgi:DNA polymerase I
MTSSFSTSTEEPKQEVLLVDLSGLFWRSWMSNGETLKARDNTLALVRRCMEGLGFQAPVALCLDRGRSFRKDLAPEYKANRPEKDLQAVDELRRTEAALAAEGFCTWGVDSFEADDVIATATQMALAAGHTVRIASSDKDLLQLVAHDGVSVLRPHKSFRDLWGKPEVLAEFGVPAYLLGDWLALVGDTSDNIPGVPGVGPKTATAFLTAYPGLSFLLDAAASGAARATLVRRNVRHSDAIAAAAEVVRQARKLVTLRTDAPITFEEIYRPRERKAAHNQQETSMATQNELSLENEPAPEGPKPAPAAPAAAPAPEPPAAPTNAPQTAAPAAPAPAARPPETKAMTQVLVPELIGPYERALEPTNASQALNMAKVLWQSGLYGKFPGPEALYAVITRGRELGVGALASLDVFHYFENKLALHAHFIRHLAQQDPDCEWFLPCPADGDDPTKIARWGTKHRRMDQPIFHTYTIEMAVDAGMCELEIKPRIWKPRDKEGKPPKDHRGNWDKRRPELLDKTCSSQLARRVYPGRALGLYSLAELGGDES